MIKIDEMASAQLVFKNFKTIFPSFLTKIHLFGAQTEKDICQRMLDPRKKMDIKVLKATKRTYLQGRREIVMALSFIKPNLLKTNEAFRNL